MAVATALAWAHFALPFAACTRSEPPRRLTVAEAVAQTSPSCQECHEEIFQAWAATDHALANRVVTPGITQAAFASHPTIADGGARFDLAWQDGQPRMMERREDGTKVEYQPTFILGHKPLWQPLVPGPGNRWQPTDMAYDVKRHEWFNIFGQENRRPGEWGHWTGRGMSWNSMCAQCHMTGYRKNYNPTTDSYSSRWVEHGIGCIQCHGAMPADHKYLAKGSTRPPDTPKPAPFFGRRERMMQTCAPCHARNEPLTDTFQPGDNYFDHYRVVLPTDPALYYPDGQQRDEVFNWTSFLTSRMGGHGGVTCLDCHDPHTTKTILPIDNNQLCLQCHAAPGRVQPNGTRAVPIDPLAHSHHKEGSTGNSCVACHMPTTAYMQRAPRHDHGWLIPDPLLNQELGIPDACSRCHTDQTVAWNTAATEQWYGPRMETRQRRRTRAVAAIQTSRAGAIDGLLALWPQEDIPAWRAAFLELLAPHADDPRVTALAREALGSTDPLVRSQAVRLLGRLPEQKSALRPLLDDPVRLVRLDAAWALSADLAADSPARRELDAQLQLGLDQPGGRLLLGQDLANRGRFDEAVAQMRQAVEWDPHSPGLRQSLGLALAQLDQIEPAATELAIAANLTPQDGATAQAAALALAEAGKLPEAARYLRLAVERQPDLHRAWYNLGLLQAQTGDLKAAQASLTQAESLAPDQADYPYALATVLLRQGDTTAARAALERTLQAAPQHPEARHLLRNWR